MQENTNAAVIKQSNIQNSFTKSLHIGVALWHMIIEIVDCQNQRKRFYVMHVGKHYMIVVEYGIILICSHSSFLINIPTLF